MTNSNTTANSARLNRAIDRVSATDLGDDQWAYWADETSRYYVVDSDDLESLCDYLDSDDEKIASDAYSHWCAGTMAEEKPKGWEPGMSIEAEIELTALESVDDPVVVEQMPTQHRSSHEAAGNWGVYPANGATRTVMSREAAEELCEDDDYDHIVSDATIEDAVDIQTDAALVREAFHLVEAHLDSGVEFETRCRASRVFARAAEEARLLRAYAPAQLRKATWKR